MAKQNIPSKIQNKFQTQLFKVGDYVYLDWLGLKYYGYIKRIQKSNNSVSYMVQTHKYSYPCGVQISQYQSTGPGVILYEQTKELGSDTIKSRYESRKISENNRGTTSNKTSKNTASRNVDSRVISEIPKPKKSRKHSTKNDVKSSSARNSDRTTKGTRKSYSKLDEAIQKQKDFLRKFT